MKKALVLGTTGLLLVMLLFSAVSVNAVQETEVEAVYNYGSAPVLDGVNDGEYTNLVGTYQNDNFAEGVGYSYVYMTHDDDYLYVYFDNVYANESFMTSNSGDWTELWFDVDNDGVWNTTYEPLFGCWAEFDVPGTGNLTYMEAYNYYNDWHNRDYGGYWGHSWDDVTNNYTVRGVDVNTSFGPSDNSDDNHTQFEYKIPKNTTYYTFNETNVTPFGGWLYDDPLPDYANTDFTFDHAWLGNNTYTTAYWGNLTFEAYDQFTDITTQVFSAMMVIMVIMVVAYMMKVMFKSTKKMTK